MRVMLGANRGVLAVMLALAFSLPGGVWAAGRNLLANGDFENAPAENPLEGWQADERMAAQIFRLDPEQKRTGRHSLAVELVEGFGRNTMARLHQDVPVEPDRWYLFRAEYKRDSFVHGGHFEIVLSSGGRRRQRHRRTFRSSVWDSREIVFHSGDADRASVSVSVSTDDVWRLSVGGTLWLDNVSLMELSDELDIALAPADARLAGGPRLDGGAVVGTGRGTAEFDADVLGAGRYYLWLRWHLPAESRSAARIGVDGASAVPVAGYRAGEEVWNRPITPTLVLDEGRRRIRVENLMAGARLKGMVLTPNPYYFPPGEEREYADSAARAAALRLDAPPQATESGSFILNLVSPENFSAPPGHWPLTQGVPLPQGHLWDASNVRLHDAQGRPVPVQASALAHWPDGSVRWLLATALAALPPGQGAAFALEYGPGVEAAAPESPVRVRETADGVSVDAGALRFTLRRDRFRFFESLQVRRGGAFVEMADGALPGGGLVDGAFTTAASPAEIAVEESGPVRAVVKVAGTHLDAEGEPSLDYAVRIYAFAGQPYVFVDHTFIARRDEPRTVPLGEVSLALPVPFGADTLAAFGGQGGQPIETALAAGQARLLQDGHLTSDDGRGRATYGFTAFSGGQTIAEGDEAAGWLRVQDGNRSVLAGVRYFWQNFPKALRVGPEGLAVELVAQREEPYLFYAGQARTHQMFFDFSAPEEAQAASARWEAFRGWPLLLAAPEWTASTEALGPLGPYDPERFAAYEHQVDEVFRHYRMRLAAAQDGGEGLGLMHFGDMSGGGAYLNLETALGEGVMVQFFRSGQRRFFDFADMAIRHFADIDIDHSESHAGGIYVHSPHARPNPPRAEFGINGHSWFAGVRNFYFLTGDARLRDVAQNVGEWYLARPRPLLPLIHYWRQPAWQGVALLCAYEMTGDARFLEGAGMTVRLTEHQKDHVGQLWPYMFSIGARVPRWYWEATDDPRARELFLHMMDDYLEKRLDPQDTSFGADPKREGMLLGNYPAARELNFYNEMAWATRLSGDERYVRLAGEDLNIQTRYALRSDVLMWGSAELVGEMGRMGNGGARTYADNRWVYGAHEPRMAFQVKQERPGPFEINLFVARRGKYCADYGGTAALYGPGGKRLGEQAVRTGGLNQYRFHVPDDGKTGIYTVVVELDDFWRWSMDVLRYDLEPGEHTLEVSGHQFGGASLIAAVKRLKVDSWVLTNDPLYQPYRGRKERRPGFEYIYQEAEEGDLSGSMRVGHHPAASGGAFIEDAEGPSGRAEARYTFAVQQGGTYRLFARLGLLNFKNRVLGVSVNRGEHRLMRRIDNMDASPFPLWSLTTSLGRDAVARYWEVEGETERPTFYTDEYLEEGPVR